MQDKKPEWQVDPEKCIVTHCDGWVFEFKRANDDTGAEWEAECIEQPLGEIDYSTVAKLSRIAGEVYHEYLTKRRN